MNVLPVTEFGSDQIEAMRRVVGDSCEEFFPCLAERFVLLDGTHEVGYAGTYSKTLLSGEVYWGMILTQRVFSFNQLAGWLRLAQSVLQNRTETLYAEAASASPLHRKFLRSCGFVEVSNNPDRVLYKWEPK